MPCPTSQRERDKCLDSSHSYILYYNINIQYKSIKAVQVKSVQLRSVQGLYRAHLHLTLHLVTIHKSQDPSPTGITRVQQGGVTSSSNWRLSLNTQPQDSHRPPFSTHTHFQLWLTRPINCFLYEYTIYNISTYSVSFRWIRRICLSNCFLVFLQLGAYSISQHCFAFENLSNFLILIFYSIIFI